MGKCFKPRRNRLSSLSQHQKGLISKQAGSVDLGCTQELELQTLSTQGTLSEQASITGYVPGREFAFYRKARF